MTANFEDSQQEQGRKSNSYLIDHREIDRFELLSAYLDGEISASDRKQVQEWLEEDPTAQRLYARLLKLRQSFQSLPDPTLEQTPENLSRMVFEKIDRSKRRKVWVWSGSAIAAVVIGTITSVLTGNDSLVPKVAQSPVQKPNSEALMIALNKPIVAIPKAPVATPLKSK